VIDWISAVFHNSHHHHHHHHVDCLTTGPYPTPEGVLQTLLPFTTSFRKVIEELLTSNYQSTRTSILTSITFPRRQFLRKLWHIQLAFLLYTVCRILLSSSALVCSLFLAQSISLSPASHLKNFQGSLMNCPRFRGAALLFGRHRDGFPVVSLEFPMTYFLPTEPWP
jgi:hypothetical protein